MTFSKEMSLQRFLHIYNIFMGFIYSGKMIVHRINKSRIILEN